MVPTAATAPSTTSTEPGSWLTLRPSSGSTMPPRIRNVVSFTVAPFREMGLAGPVCLQAPRRTQASRESGFASERRLLRPAQREATTTFSSTSLSPVRTYHSQRAPSGPVTQVSDFSA